MKKSLFRLSLAMLLMTLWTSSAFAQDVRVPVQGLVTDREGVPLEGDVTIQFTLYADDNEGASLWTTTRTLRVARGTFSTLLGAETALDAGLFEANPGVTLTLKIAEDEETARVPLGWAPMSASAERAKVAADAQTLQGLTPDDLRDVSAASVTYDDTDAELGAQDTQAAFQAVLARLKTLETANADLSTKVAQLESSAVSPMTVQALEARVGQVETEQQAGEAARMSLSARLDTVSTNVTSVTTSVTSHTSRLGALETSQSTQDQSLANFQMTTSARLNTLDTEVAGLDASVMSAASTAGAAATAATNASNTVNALGGRVTGNEQALSALQTSDQSQSTTLMAYDSRLDTLETASNTGLDARITTLETKTASMSVATINSQPAVIFEAVNLHVRSGSGATSGVVNGRGNLVLGYDETRLTSSDKTGSHNLVLGRQANYSSYGGVVGGDNNTISGTYAMVFTGAYNEATQDQSAVITGRYNDAIAQRAVVVAGNYNEASGSNAAVVSGTSNRATNTESVVISGSTNVSSGTTSVIVSGYDNMTDSYRSVVVGGWINELLGTGTNYSVLGGGDSQTITGAGNERTFFPQP